MDMSMGNPLYTMSQRYPTRVAVIEGAGKGRRSHFRELNERANMCSHGLIKMGVNKGDFVSILMHNCIEYVEILNALAKTGAVNASLVYRLAPSEMALLVNNCDATMLIFGSEFASIIDQIKDGLKTVKYYVCVGEGGPSYATPYEDLLKDQPVTEPDVEIFDDDPCFLNYTSGTTGMPKAVLLSHYNNVAGALCTFANPWYLGPDDVMLCVFPLYGRIGMAQMFACMMTGCRQVIMDFDPKKCLEAIERERVTLLHAAPVMSYMMLEELKQKAYDVSSIRGVISVGAPITEPIHNTIRERICPNVWDYSGTQETAGNYVALPHMKRVNYATLGTPTLFTKFRIVDPEGKDLQPGEIGEIIARTAQASTEYFKDSVRTKEEIKNSWFYIRDVGHIDENGWVALGGRTKDMIKPGGQQVMAPEVENVIMSHPAVADCAVVGLPDARWGETVTAVVALKRGATATEEEIMNLCRDKMAHFKAPRKVIFRSEIPRLPTGKVPKFKLVEEYSGKK